MHKIKGCLPCDQCSREMRVPNRCRMSPSETWVISDAVKDEALFRHSGTYLQSQHLRERARQNDHEFKTSLGYIVRAFFQKYNQTDNNNNNKASATEFLSRAQRSHGPQLEMLEPRLQYATQRGQNSPWSSFLLLTYDSLVSPLQTGVGCCHTICLNNIYSINSFAASSTLSPLI